jgi:hypothetical protein
VAGLTQIVSVFDARIYRVLKAVGCNPQSIGRPRRIGGTISYAGLFDTGEGLLQAGVPRGTRYRGPGSKGNCFRVADGFTQVVARRYDQRVLMSNGSSANSRTAREHRSDMAAIGLPSSCRTGIFWRGRGRRRPISRFKSFATVAGVNSHGRYRRDRPRACGARWG